LQAGRRFKTIEAGFALWLRRRIFGWNCSGVSELRYMVRLMHGCGRGLRFEARMSLKAGLRLKTLRLKAIQAGLDSTDSLIDGIQIVLHLQGV
jgi:hypothetical protein